jgi:DNA-binding protein Fis
MKNKEKDIGDSNENLFSPKQKDETNVSLTAKRNGIGFVFEEYLREFYAAQDLNFITPQLYEKIIQEVERPLLLVTLEVAKGNRKQAACLLGINRNTFLKKMRLLGLDEKYESETASATNKKRTLLKNKKSLTEKKKKRGTE